MFRIRILTVLLVVACFAAVPLRAQLGKSVIISAGSEVDHQLNDINAATDPAAKLKLIDAFSAAHPEADLQILADEQYVNYYLNAKQYDKAFEYGDKLFALDPDNFSNAVNMVRAANEKGDTERLFAAGEKAAGILQRFKAQPPPAGASPEAWKVQQQRQLETIKDNQDYIEQSLMNAAYQQKDPAKKAALLVRYADLFPDSPNSVQALGAAAVTYQQAQNRSKMLETANSVLAKDPDNLGMLLLLADDYSEKGEQLDKAEAFAKKAASLCDTAKKPEGVSDADWQKQINLQKGLALSAMGQIDLQKKLNSAAVDSLTKAAPLLKSNAAVYARNQYRLGFAYLNVKKTAEAKQAFTDAASVDSPYKGPAQDKLKGLAAAKAPARKAS
jgi:tetratricopeptide (TPR) repeat protein